MFFPLRSCDFPFSVYIKKHIASIAQLVEHLTCNHEVTGSTPVAGSSFQSPATQQVAGLVLFWDFSILPEEIAL